MTSPEPNLPEVHAGYDTRKYPPPGIDGLVPHPPPGIDGSDQSEKKARKLPPWLGIVLAIGIASLLIGGSLLAINQQEHINPNEMEYVPPPEPEIFAGFDKALRNGTLYEELIYYADKASPYSGSVANEEAKFVFDHFVMWAEARGYGTTTNEIEASLGREVRAALTVLMQNLEDVSEMRQL